jgi:glyoxylase-like metal-dependent hydrolase (beta-lactamase superfamily II)
MTAAEPYEVFALRYGASGPRTRRLNFLSADEHDGPMPMDYFVWAIRNAARVVIVDTGFTRAAAGRRQRVFLRDPLDLMREIGIDPAAVTDVILTHLHYDHAGGLDGFPQARFHLQDAEMAYATGRSMRHAALAQPFDVEDVTSLVRRVYAGRVCFHDGDGEVAPGISVHRVGGHTAGLQVVRVLTARGHLVLGSDAFHFTENRRRRSPFPLVFHVGEMLEAYELCERLADGEDLIVPGHDPLVMQLWPKVADGVVRLDLPQRTTEGCAG